MGYNLPTCEWCGDEIYKELYGIEEDNEITFEVKEQ